MTGALCSLQDFGFCIRAAPVDSVPELLYDVYHKGENSMLIEIDFQSDEAIYMQLRNQIVLGIAASVIREGDPLPSVRALAGDIGINMHTVNKAYALLREEGFVTIDRRRGAVISLNIDKLRTMQEMQERLQVILAKGICKNISRQEVHEMVDEIYDTLQASIGRED